MHGYDHPWAGGAGKNKLVSTAAQVKTWNGGAASWSGNTKTYDGLTVTLLEDNGGNFVGVKFNGSNPNLTTIKVGEFTGLSSSILNGCPSGGGSLNYNQQIYDIAETSWGVSDYGSGVSLTTDASKTYAVYVIVRSGVSVSNLVFEPMVRLSSETDSAFSPYTNISPISGRTGTTVSTRNADNTETASATISFGQTVYGGQVDFKTGNVTVEWGYIASYNGETLPGAWISDRDVYVAGTTPTTGAEVCYELATPTTLSLTPDILTMLKNNNSVSGDGVITITALTGDSWS